MPQEGAYREPAAYVDPTVTGPGSTDFATQALEAARRREAGLPYAGSVPMPSSLGAPGVPASGSYYPGMSAAAENIARAGGVPGPVETYPSVYGRPPEETGAPVEASGHRLSPEEERAGVIVSGGGGPAVPRVPDDLQGTHGGFYYPPDYVDRVMARVNSGEIDAGVGALALSRYRERRGSQLGLLSQEYEIKTKAQEQRLGLAQGLGQMEQQATNRARYTEGIAGLHEERLIQQQKIAQEQRAMAERMTLQNIAEADRRARDFKIDPDRLWRQRGGGAHFIATLGVALAEFGRVMTGGQRNVALEIVQSAIDREVDAQKAESQGLKDDAAAQRNLYGMMRVVHQDDAMAEAQTRRELWSAAQQYAQAQLGDVRDAQQQAKQAEAMITFGEQVKLADIDVQKKAQMMADEVTRRRIAAESARAQVLEKRRLLERIGYPLPRDRKGVTSRAPIFGLGVVAVGSDPEKVRDKIAATDTILQNMDRAIAIIERNPYGSRIIGDDAAVLEMLESHIDTPVFKEMAGVNVKPEEKERLTALRGGDYRSLTREAVTDVVGIIRKSQRIMRSNLDNYIHQHVELGKVTPYVNEKGDPEIYFKPEGGGEQLEQRSRSTGQELEPGAVPVK